MSLRVPHPASVLTLLAGAAAVAGCAGSSPGPEVQDPPADDDGGGGWVGSAVDRVDPRIGTGGLGFGVGSAFPGPSMPFGMIKPSPDTSADYGAPGFSHCAGYWSEDPYIDGFSHTRMHGIGVADFGNVLLMPTSGMDPAKTDEEGYRSAFSTETEQARPGYYAVTLDDTGIVVELTATDRAAHHRYTFPAGLEPVVVLDACHVLGENSCGGAEVTLSSDEGVVEGWMVNVGGLAGRNGGIEVYFSVRFDAVPSAFGTWNDGALAEGSAAQAGESDVGAWFGFDLPAGGTVEAQVGISFRGVAAARANREAEMPGWDFDGVREAAEAAWEDALRVVEVEGGTEAQQRVFYTAVYHSMLMPDLLTDADGLYPGFDGEEHVADGFLYYSDMSLWDTFRTLHPLLILLAPDRQRDFVVSLGEMYRQGGAYPRWPAGTADSGSMIGESADLVIAESWIKGIRDFDVETAWEGLVAGADGTLPEDVGYGGRPGLDGYLERGWCAVDEVGGSTSVTLEYAYDDYALSLLARALGREEEAARFEERSRGWRGLWDPSTGFLEGRYADGTVAERATDTSWEDWYTEANAWQTLWYVPHDPQGLIELMGGDEAFVARLDSFFDQAMATEDTIAPDPYYWHGNETDLHAPWLYLEASRPDRTQERVRWILSTKYGDGPDGLDGNDDGGTLSAWYVFAALGFYPVAGTDRYWVGSPLFPRATVHLAGGDLVIEAPGVSDSALYVQSATLDGEPLDRPWFTHDRIADGGTLVLEMGEQPSPWGTGG